MDITFEDACQQIYKVELYELRGESEWIKEILYQLNKLGFLTITSQPGSENPTCMYKSLFHLKNRNTDGMIMSDDSNYRVVRKQRAYIRGYMKSEMADFIVNKLANDKYLFVRSNNNNNKILDDDIKLGSVIFVNDVPVVNEFPDETDPKLVPDSGGSFNFNLPLRRPITVFYPNIQDIDSISEFDILDRRWNDNSHLWTCLLETIKEYLNSH